MDTRLHTPCTSLTIKQRKKKKRKKRQTLTYILQPSGHASRVKRNLRERTALSLPRPPLSLSIFLRPVERVYIREEAANFSASQDLYTHTHTCVCSRGRRVFMDYCYFQEPRGALISHRSPSSSLLRVD